MLGDTGEEWDSIHKYKINAQTNILGVVQNFVRDNFSTDVCGGWCGSLTVQSRATGSEDVLSNEDVFPVCTTILEEGGEMMRKSLVVGSPIVTCRYLAIVAL